MITPVLTDEGVELTIYQQATGRVLRCMEFSSTRNVLDNIADDEEAIEGVWDPATHRIDLATGDPVMLPVRPSSVHVFDFATLAWVDPRTPADFAAELAARRERTRLDKAELLFRLRAAKLLSWEQAVDASAGNVPAIFAEFFAQMTPEAQAAAMIKWQADTVISRMHPVIVAAAYAVGITDLQLDAIFGIAA